MIEFDFNQAGSWKWIVLALVLILLLVQYRFLFVRRGKGNKPPVLRKILNMLLWILVLAFVLNPVFYSDRTVRKAVLPAKGISGEEARKVADSLKAEVIRLTDGLNEVAYDTVFLLGQDFDAGEELSRLGSRTIKWIPRFRSDRIQSIGWDAVVWKGQSQRVAGTVFSSAEQYLKAVYAGKTLDSVLLKPGDRSFNLAFPVFAAGRVSAELFLEKQKLADIRFFAGTPSPLTYQFVLEHPDFETTTLANWLGRKGNRVTVASWLSKNVANEKVINNGGDADVLITEPGSLDNLLVREAVRNKKSIVVMGMTQPETEIPSVNRVLNTDLKVNKIAGSEEIDVGKELTALPFRFVDSGRSFGLVDLPVAVSAGRSAVAVTLLKETFPLLLSGDSLAYESVWNKILSQVSPVEKSQIASNAPLFSGVGGTLNWDQESIGSSFFQVKTPSLVDTLFFEASPLNSNRLGAVFIPVEPGAWYETLTDPSAEFYVEEVDGYLKEVGQVRMISGFAEAVNQRNRVTNPKKMELTGVRQTIPGFVWIVIFLLVFGALWFEPKFSGSGAGN